MKQSSSVLLGALAAALLGAVPWPAAQAADKPQPQAQAQAKPKAREPVFGQGKPLGPVLTRAELRECLSQQDQIRTQDADLQKERAQLEADKAELVRSGAVLTEALNTLDRTSQEAVDQYNAKATERDAAIEALNKKSDAFNAKVGSLQEVRTSFTKACNNRRYDERDETAIREGK